jgi:hypothetical protein
MLQYRIPMIRLKTALLISVLSLATTGCVAHGRASGGAVVRADLILVELHPGVWVIEDHDEPVFYADGYFWLYRDDGWYRSSDHTRGWVRYRAAPEVIVRIEQPRRYVRYRAEAGHRVRRGPNGPISVRDHRGQDRREEQQERREEKREEQQERKEEKREEQLEKREEKREEQQEKREEKLEKREEKRDDQAERREDKAEKREDKVEAREEKREDKAEKREDKAEKREDKGAKPRKK